jgi:hypothetical protein
MLFITLFMPVIARVLTSIIVFLMSGWTEIFCIDLTQIKVKSAQWLQYGFWISFLDETYLFLLVCVSLNLREYFYWKLVGDAFNSLLALMFGILVVIFPIFVAIFYSYKPNYEKIEKRNPDFLARYGGIIRGLNFKRR